MLRPKETGKYLQYCFDSKTIFLDLLLANNWDINHLPIKKNCTLFRYSTTTTLACGMRPAIMVNIDKSLIYFFNARSETWEKRGIKNVFDLSELLSEYK